MKEGLIIGIIILLLSKKTTANSNPDSKPFPGTGSYRGMKNNNPGNIRISNTQWQGKIPIDQNTDGAFEQFYDMKMGVRASLINMRTWHGRGRDTITKLIETWAPYSDNPYQSVINYINYVSQCSGIPKDQYFAYNKQNATNIARCMFLFENAGESPTATLINQAYDLI